MVCATLAARPDIFDVATGNGGVHPDQRHERYSAHPKTARVAVNTAG
ncbi:hypothetical protein MFUM_480017 [Methylacidiphilum fumariolicum SolV]|uniref:Uncharacterized protein n=3 Tax=Candidatus Methylacidiphilum fumarolicum TaxID=591154 RepID=I0JY81_METFB|nr:conserved protein of unknown function [Candidatus Methylacidiphilum fumarolicum]CCG92200.1 hypothetical protein MFUM_480017 [Methylacidiphilum fumariolicum SolV]